jgi:hypothetical protein
MMLTSYGQESRARKRKGRRGQEKALPPSSVPRLPLQLRIVILDEELVRASPTPNGAFLSTPG